MKTLAAVLTILALGAVSIPAFAGCGSNTARNANTRPTSGNANLPASQPGTPNTGFHH